MKLLTSIVGLGVAMCCAGCGSFGVKPPISEKVNSREGNALIAFHDDRAFVNPDPASPDQLTEIKGVFQETLDSSCRPVAEEKKIPAAVVPVLAAAAELAFNLFIEDRRRQINEVVEASMSTYSVSAVVDPGSLAKMRCLLIVRYSLNEKSKQPVVGMFAMLRLLPPFETSESRTFQIRPTYVKMADTVAWTRAVGADQDKASVSFAISIKAVARQGPGVARLLPVGEGVAFVPGVVLGEKTPRCMDSTCERSDLLVFPRNKGPLSFTLAVTEKGVTGFDEKAEVAKLEAVKAAIGPAIAEAIRAHFAEYLKGVSDEHS